MHNIALLKTIFVHFPQRGWRGAHQSAFSMHDARTDYGGIFVSQSELEEYIQWELVDGADFVDLLNARLISFKTRVGDWLPEINVFFDHFRQIENDGVTSTPEIPDRDQDGGEANERLVYLTRFLFEYKWYFVVLTVNLMLTQYYLSCC